jgi:hypothetical protein
MKWRAWGICLLACISWARGAPVDDLASPDPDVRAHAAQMIREQHLYQPTPRDRWDKLAASFRVGETPAEALKQVQQAGFATSFPPQVWDNTHPNEVRGVLLDDCWILEFHFGPTGLSECWVRDNPREILVSPPAHYSGTWHTYRIDGYGISRLYIDGKSFEGIDGRPESHPIDHQPLLGPAP